MQANVISSNVAFSLSVAVTKPNSLFLGNRYNYTQQKPLQPIDY